MADVILEMTVPEAWIAKTLHAFNTITDTHLTLTSRGHLDNPDGTDFDGKWDFRIEDKLSTEDNKEFGERVARKLLIAVVNMVDYAEDEVRYRDEVSAISPPASDVPDDILTK